MYKFIAKLALAVLAGGALSGIAASASAQAAAGAEQPVKVVYHITTGIDTAALALYNIKNHLDADPKAKIVVVTNSSGVEFLVQDAKDSKGREFSSPVSTLAERGVEFRVCKNTLVDLKIPAGKLLMETSVVPSGVAEVARLQAREGYVYIKP